MNRPAPSWKNALRRRRGLPLRGFTLLTALRFDWVHAQSPADPQGPPTIPNPLAPALNGTQVGEFLDISPPVEVPFWTGGKLTIAVVVGLATVTALLVLIRIWTSRGRPAPEPPDPRQIALRALFNLRSAAEGDMEPRDFAAAVAEVLRTFIESKYRVAAPKQTTEEFLASAQTHALFSPPELSRLRSFLTQCDLLKFARSAATPAARHELLNMAESQVRESTS